MAHHPGWYDRNEERAYPLADQASRVDDEGVLLPSSLLVDCRLRFPRTAGRYAFVGALTVTPGVVALVILGADQLDQTSGFTTLATLSVPQPATARRLLSLEPQYPGVGGWVALGQGVREHAYRGRFSSPEQSLILAGLALAYEPPSIPYVGKLGLAAQLSGLVRLAGGNDIEIVRECREIPAYPAGPALSCDELVTTRREVIVFRLADKQTSGRNVLDHYRGPCSNRPESRNCGDPEPIEFIGAVAPDCCGNITIDLLGCAILNRVVEVADVDEDGNVVSTSPACGVVLDCDQGLSDACLRERYLPTLDGVLPGEVDSLCVSQTVSQGDGGDGGDGDGESFTLDPDQQDDDAEPTLPITTDFSVVEADLDTVSGHGFYDAGVFSTDSVDAVALRNLFLWDAEINGRHKVVTVRGEMRPGPASPSGVLHNLAVVAGYREVGSSGRHAYWMAELDWDGHYLGYPLFQLVRYNGIRWVRVLSAPLSELALGDSYELSLDVFGHEDRPEDAWVRARLKGISDPLVAVTLGPVLTDDYPPGNVKFGFGTNRAAAHFTHFEIDNTNL